MQPKETTTPEQPTQQPAAAPSTDGGTDGGPDDLVAAAIAVANGETPEVDAKTEGNEAAPEATPPEAKDKPEAKPDDKPPADEEAAPTLDDLRAEIAARKQGKPPTASEQKAEDKKIAEALASIPLDDFKSDPAGALIAAGLNPRETMRALAQATLGTQAKKPAEPKGEDKPDIEALVQKAVADALKPYQQKEAEREAAQQREEAENEFLELTADGQKYQYLGALTDEERIAYGNQIADQYAAAGRSVTLELVARTLNQHMQSLAERFRPDGSAGPSENTQSAPGSETKPPNGAPKSLPQSLPATQVKKPQREPETEEERIQAAIRVAEAGG